MDRGGAMKLMVGGCEIDRARGYEIDGGAYEIDGGAIKLTGGGVL